MGNGNRKDPGLLCAPPGGDLFLDEQLGCWDSGTCKTIPFQDPLICLEATGHPNI